MAEENPITPNITPQEETPQMINNNPMSEMNLMQGSQIGTTPVNVEDLDVINELFTSNVAPAQSDDWMRPHAASMQIASRIAAPLDNIQLPGMGGPDIFRKNPKVNEISPDQRLNNDLFGDIMHNVSDAHKDSEGEVSAPMEFGIKNTNYDRYYNHTNFQELGFHPYVDNESIYNVNSTWWDDNKRMRKQFWKVAGTGFMSSWNAIGDFFSGDYTEPDLEASEAYEDAMRVGRSSKGGVGAFTNNLILNSGYTVGIMANIAVEELVLAGLELVTVGGATPLVASRTAYNALRIGKALDRSMDTSKYTYKSADLLKKMNDVDNAKHFWGAGGKLSNWTTDLFFGGIKSSMSKVKTLKDSGKALSALARGSSHFAGFYRDVRRINLAFAEGKLEAGGVVTGTFNQLYNEHLEKHGKPPTGEEITEMHNKSHQAGFTTLMWNLPIIYFSNAIVFDNMLRGFRPLATLMDASIKGVGRRIIKKGVVKEGQKAFVDAGSKRFQRFLKRGFSGNLKTFGGELLRYTSRNSVEGFQELFQEAIAVGAQDYYTTLYNDPAANSMDAQLASVYAGAKSQAGAQGFEVFMSGFLMGGLVQGPQRIIMNGGSNLYNRLADPKAFEEYKKNRDEYIEETVNILNEIYEDPEKYFDPSKLALLTQKMQNERMFASSYAGDIKSFVDANDASTFHSLYRVMEVGKMSDFKQQMKDYLKLDDEGLAKAFPMVTAEEAKSGKGRRRIETMLDRMDDIEKGYKELNEKIKNPYDSKQYKKFTKEWVNEVIREQAFNHAKMMAMFTRHTFKRALERSNSIMEKLTSDPIIAKMANNEIQSLADMQTLISEIKVLKIELKNMLQTDEDGKKIKLSEEDQGRYDKKEQRLKLLQKYFAVITDPVNLESAPTKGASKGASKVYKARGGAPGTRTVGEDEDIRGKKLRGKNAQYANTKSMQDKGKPIRQSTDTVTVDGVDYRFKIEEFEDGKIFYNVSEIATDDKGGMPIRSLTKAEFEALNEKYIKNAQRATSDKQKIGEEGRQSVQKVREEILSTGLEENQTDKTVGALFGEGGLNFFGDFNTANKDKLKEVLNEYLQFIADENKDFINHDNIDNFIDLLLDYRSLKGRANDYNKAIKTILDPDSLYSVAEKVAIKLKESFEKNKLQVRSRMEKYVEQGEKTKFIEKLAKLGIYPDAAQVERFLKGEAGVPGYYETNEGELSEFTNADLNQQKNEIIESYTQLSNNKKKKQEKEEKAKEEKEYDEETLYDEVDDEFDYEETHYDDAGQDTQSTPRGKQHLVREYRNYLKNKTGKGKILDQSEWLRSPLSHKARKVEHAINRIWQELYQREIMLGNKATFDEWLNVVSEEENQDVHDILKSVDLTVNDILGEDTRQKKLRKKAGPLQEIKKKESESGIYIRKEKIKDKSTGETETLFRLVDSNNDTIEADEYYSTESKAKAAKNKLIKKEAKVAKANEPFEFDGVEYRQKDILEDKDGNQYMVFSSPKMVSDNNNLYIKRIEKKNSTNKEDKMFLSAEQVVELGLEQAPEDLHYTKRGGKIKLNEPISLYPARKSKEEIPEYQQRVDEAKKRFYKALKDLTKEDRENLTIRVTRGESWDAMQQVAIEDKEGFSEKKDMPKNPRIKKNAQEFSVEIQLEGVTIAYFQGPSTVQLLDKKAQKEIDPTTLERSDIVNLFKLQGKSTKEAVEIIKNNYNKGYALYTKFREALGNEEEVVINAKELGIKFLLSPGSLDIVEENQEGTSFEDLDYNKIEGVNKDDVRGDDQPWVVIDFSRTYTRKGKTKSEVIRTNIKKTSKSFKTIHAKIEELRKNTIEPSEFLGKYVAFVTLPNGTSVFVKLSPSTMEVNDLNTLLNDIKKQSKTTEEKNLHEVEGKMRYKKDTFNHNFNEELQSKYFIASEPGIYYEIKLTREGALRINYSNMNLKEGDPNKRDKAIIEAKNLKELNDFADLAKLVNEELSSTSDQQKGKNIFSLDKFKQFISKEIEFSDVKIMNTPYNEGLIKDVSMTLDIDESVMSMEVIKREAEKSKPKKEDITPITAEERRAIIKSKYKVVPPQFLLYIAKKMHNGKDLTSFENRVKENNELKLTEYKIQAASTSVNVNNVHEKKDGIDALKLEDLYNRKAEKRKEIRKKARADNPDVPGSEIRKLYNNEYKNDEELINIENRIKEVENSARKILDNFDGHEITDIETFVTWAKQNLPESIKIEIDELGEKLKDGYMTVGMFMLRMKALARDITGIEGTIRVGTNSPFKYHEAFHAVFRMLLSEADIKKYLAIAKKDARAALRKEGKTLKEALAEMRKQHSSYANMPADILEERYYEEYMADEFEKFKLSPKSANVSSETKSLFQKIIDTIRWILTGFKKDMNSKKGGLQSLFRDIDSGRFKNAITQTNRFTENQRDFTYNEDQIARKLIMGKKVVRLEDVDGNEYPKTITNFMPADHEHKVTSAMANLYIKRRREAKAGTNTKELLDSTIMDVINMYNPDRKFYTDQTEWYDDMVDELESFHDALEDQIDDITDLVVAKIDEYHAYLNITDELTDEDYELAAEVGDWDKNNDMIGGISSLPKRIRTLIATTTLEEEDMFGNIYLDETLTDDKRYKKTRERLIISVDPHRIYNGLLKVLANTPNDMDLLRKMWTFSKNNSHTRAVVRKFFDDVGLLTVADNGDLFNSSIDISEHITDSGLYVSFMKGFQKYRVDYMMAIKDKKTKITHLFAANKKDDAHHTVAQWAEDFNNKYNSIKIKGSEAHNDAITALGELRELLKSKQIDTEVMDDIETVRDLLQTSLGMNVHSDYITYSILARLKSLKGITPEQKILHNTYKHIDPIDIQGIEEIEKSLSLGENLYIDNQVIEEWSEESGELEVEKAKGGAKYRLRRMAIDNAPFDESVGASTFIGPDGNRRYSHQDPTFHLVKVAEMDGDYIKEKKLEDQYFESNMLLNDDKFIRMVEAGLVRPMRISGRKTIAGFNMGEDILLEKTNDLEDEGKSFGSLTGKEFILAIMDSYTYFYNRVNPSNTLMEEYIDNNGEPQKFAVSPNFIRVIEASDTGDFAVLPIHKMLAKEKDGIHMSDEALDKFIDEIRREYERGLNYYKNGVEDDYIGEERLGTLNTTYTLLTRLKSNRKGLKAQLPGVGAVAQEAIADGEQSITLANVNNNVKSNVSGTNESGIVIVGEQEFVMHNKGKVDFSKLSGEEKTSMIKKIWYCNY